MFSLEDDLIIELHHVNWLVLVNLLVLILIIILLYSCTKLASSSTSVITNNGASYNEQCSSSNSSSNSISITGIYSQHNQSKVNPERRINTITCVSRNTNRYENNAEEIEESKPSGNDVKQLTISDYPYNPCNLFELITKAFLQCLGVDSQDTKERIKRR